MIKKLLVLFIALSVGFTSTIDIRAVVEDTTPPMVTGVEEGGIYKAPVTIGFDEGIALLNDVEIANPTTVSELGEYVLVVTDQSNNVTTVHFSLVEAVAPVVLGVTNGASYTDPVTITFDEGTATLNGNAFVSGSLVSAHGAYTLVVTDEYDNVTTVNFSIVAKTAAVSGFKVVNAGYNAISLSWTAVSNVTGYEIWRSTGTSTVYAGVTSVTTNSFMNTGLAFNTKYNYKVRVFTLINNVKVYGAFSVIGSATTALTTPVTSVVSASYNSIRVSWAAIPGVSGYQVYRATSLAGTYTLLTSTSATSYTNSLLTTNTLYYYKVRGYRTVGTLKYYSAYSTVLSARPIPSQVIGNSVVSSGYNSLKASWAAVSGATGYEVYKSSAVDGTYTLVLTTGLTSYSFTSLPTNVPLFVKVRAYRLVGTVKVYGAFSTIQSSSPIPSNPLVTLTSLSYKSLKLSWAAVSGATGYEVYHREGENYVLVQESSDLSLTDDGLVSGVTHDYKVIAYRMEGETKVYSKETLISGKALPSVPSVSSLVNYNTIKLKWNAVEGAVGYEIHRSTTATGTFTLLSTVDVLEYNHLALVFNTSYFYKVRAYVVVNDVKVYGNFTGVLTVKTNVATPIVTAKSASYISATVSWATVSGASGYEISRATVLAGPYTVIVPATGLTSYTNSALTTNTLYYYRVRSYRLVGTVKYYSAYSTVVSVRPVPAVPTGVSLTSVGYDSARLGWVAVTGATGYEVFTSDALGGTYTLKATTSSLSATISGLSTNVLVYAKVRAYRLVGTTKVYGDYSSIVNVAPIPAKPVVTVGNLSHTSIKVSWPTIAGADGYEVYHLVGSDYVLVQDNNELSLTVNELVSGEVHTYKVLAYRIVNEVRVYSQETIASGKAFPLTPVVTAAINYASIQLNWATVEGASGYEVVRSATSTGTYALVATVNTNTYLNSGLAFNTTYYYKVRAYALVNDVKVYGNYTGILTYKTNVANPVVNAVSTSYISANVTWTAVSGASGYEVSRATALAGPYTVLVAATSATSYANSALTTNTLYYYRVRSYRLVGTVKYYSAYSTVVSVRPVPAMPTGLALVSAGHDSVKATWTAVTGATGYEVYTSDAQDGTYTLKATVTTNTATVSGYATNALVYARVRAYRLVGTTKVFGDFSATMNGRPIPSTPVVTVSSPSATSLKLTWAAIPGASGYEIYKMDSDQYLLVSDTVQTSYTRDGLHSGYTYSFKVKAYKLVDEVKVYSAEATISAKAVPPVPANFKAETISYNSIKVSWDASPGAYGYDLYRSTSPTGPFTHINSFTTTEYIDRYLTFNSTYYYKIKPFLNDGTTVVNGSESGVVSAKAFLITPHIGIGNEYNYNVLEIQSTWVEGAVSYLFYRATSINGTYTLVSEQNSSVYYDRAMTINTTYYYKVRVYRGLNSVNYYTPYSNILTYKAVPASTSWLDASVNTLDSITVKWNAVTGASGYEIDNAKTQNGPFTLVYSGTATTFVHTGLPFNQTNYYRQRTFRTVNGVKIYGPYTTGITKGVSGVSAPTLSVIQEYDQDLVFEITSSTYGISGYKFYLVDPITQELTYYAAPPAYDNDRLFVSDYREKVGQTFTFVAVAEKELNGVMVQSNPSAPVTLTLGQTKLAGFKTSSSYKATYISWTATFNEIELYRADAIDGEYTLLVSQKFTSPNYTDNDVALGDVHYYKARRISYDQNGEKVYSEFTEVITGEPKLNITLSGFFSYVRSPYDLDLSWSIIDGATGYEVFVAFENGGEFYKIKDVVEPKLQLTDLMPEETYYFMFRGFADLTDGRRVYAPYSKVIYSTMPQEPSFTMSANTAFDGQTKTLFTIQNLGDYSANLSFYEVYAFDINIENSQYAVKVTDTSGTQVMSRTMTMLSSMPFYFEILEPGITYSPSIYLYFCISYDGVGYEVVYNPYDDMYFFYPS